MAADRKGLDFSEGSVLDLNSAGYWMLLLCTVGGNGFSPTCRRRPRAIRTTGGKRMASIDEQILRASKEIVVKFIEVGRVSPTTFHDSFRDIHATVQEAVKGPRDADGPLAQEKELNLVN